MKNKAIVVIGDIHGEIFKVNDCISHAEKLGSEFDQKFEVIGALQVGDFGLYDQPTWRKYRDGKAKFKKFVGVTFGNHESPQEVRKVQGRQDLNDSLYVFNQIDFRTLFGLKILSVGGAMSVDPMGENTHVPHWNSIYDEAITEWFKRGKPRVDIIVTHEAPSNSGLVPNAAITERYGVTAELGSVELRRLIETVQPAIQVNGHHHVWNNCQIPALGEMSCDATDCWTLPIPFCGSHLWNASSRSGYGLIHVEGDGSDRQLRFEPILMTQHVDY